MGAIFFCQKKFLARWWCMPLIPGLGRQWQMDLFEFEVSLGCYTQNSSRKAKTEKKENYLKETIPLTKISLKDTLIL